MVAALLGPPLVVIAAVTGTVAVLLFAPPGRALTARLLTERITGAVAGRVEIGSLGGGILGHLVLEDVTVRDSLGVLLLDAPRIEANYRLRDLLRGRIVFAGLQLDRPTIHLARLRERRWNYENVFRIKPRTGPTPPQLVEFRNVEIRGATLRVDVPTSPKPPRVPISRQSTPLPEPEVVTTSDGLVRVYRAAEFDARLPWVRLSTPQRDPIFVEIENLAARISDPAIRITGARGTVLTAADSLRFVFEEASLPATVVRGGGAVRWPRDTVMFDFELAADTVDLADLRFISPDFPDWTGKGRVVALATAGSRTDYRLEELTLGRGESRAEGRLIASVDVHRGLGMRQLDLALTKVPLAVLRPYLDTLPFAGTLTGRLRADGFFDRLTLGGDLQFVDSLTADTPASRLVFEGPIRFGGTEGATFDRFVLNRTRFPMATITTMIPAVILPGELTLQGSLDGPWQNARFDGVAEHTAPDGALSRMIGQARFDVRDTLLAIDLDLRLDQLSFDGLRSGYPELTPRGGLIGRVIARGRLDAVQLDADVVGEIGVIRARGEVGLLMPRLTADSLVIDLRRLDADALLGQGGSTALNGTVTVSGVIDSATAPAGSLLLALGQSRVGGITFSEVTGSLHSDGMLLGVDSVTAFWPEGQIIADGTVGWVAPHVGTMLILGDAASLTPFDSLARAFIAFPRDTIGPRPLEGEADFSLTLQGSLDSLDLVGVAEVQSLRIDRWGSGMASLRLQADAFGHQGLVVEAILDSLGFEDRLARDVTVLASGRRDSLSLRLGAQLLEAEVAAKGAWEATDDVSRLALDSLLVGMPSQRWQLSEPTAFRLTGGRVELETPVRLATEDGGGALVLTGSVPGSSPGTLEASLVGFDLSDAYAMLSRDTAGVGGFVAVDLRLGGTLEAPTFRGNASVTGLVVADARPPLARVAFDYQDRRLRSRVNLWKTGESILEVDLSLPVDLALAPRTERKLPGPLEIQATADSADLAILEAFTVFVRETRGALALNLLVSGGWDAPRLDGTVALIDGRTELPALHVRYDQMTGRGRFLGDSLVIDSLGVQSGGGQLTIDGSVRFAPLTRPTLDLRLTSRGFLAADVPNFLTVRPTGQVTLTGPLMQPVMRGEAVLNSTDFYFADLVNKNVINLEDQAFADFVDREELQRLQLGAAFQNRFLDSLRIENLRFSLGREVWLRSAEANVQLEGAVVVNKLRQEYRLDGEFTALRGTYRLAVGIVNRDFIVERGTVRYVGTPDLNADLDLQARHLVFTEEGEEIPVVARITGSIQVPKLALSSPGRNIAERDLLSYVMFGRPEFQVAGSGQRGTGDVASAQALQFAAGALSSEIERTLVQEAGLGLDMFEFRPVLAPGSQSTGQFNRFAAGWQVGRRWFVTLNAGFCVGGQEQQFSARNLGASLEYRITRDWRVQASAEPVQSCLIGQLSDFGATLRYQLGADLLWEREY